MPCIGLKTCVVGDGSTGKAIAKIKKKKAGVPTELVGEVTIFVLPDM